MSKALRAYELWRIDPELALEVLLIEGENRLLRDAHCWQTQYGIDGTGYGSFQPLRRSMLEGRRYHIEFWDGKISICWLDVVHDPRYIKGAGIPRNLPFHWFNPPSNKSRP